MPKFYDFHTEREANKFFARLERLNCQVGHPVQNPITKIWTVIVL